MGDPTWKPNIMGTILWRPFYGDLISIIETTLWRPNFGDLILWKLYYRNLIMENLVYIYIYCCKTSSLLYQT